MADETKQILIDVEVSNQDADKAIGDLNTQIRKNREEIKELSKDYEENSTEIAKLEQENKKLAGSKRDLIKQNSTEANSLNALRLKLANLTAERNNLDTSIAGNAERFKELQKEIKGTSDEISSFEQEGGDFRRNVGNYKSAIDGLGLAFKALGIGLVVAALNELREAFLQNQKVADFFSTAVNVVKNVTSDLVNGLVNLITNFEDSWGKIKEFFTGKSFGDIVDSVKEYGSSTLEAAESQTELAKSAELNAVKQQRVIQQLERQAEQQRQIRDDETKSIGDRIRANEQLGDILQDQQKRELALIDTRVQLARLQVESNNNVENQIALQEALLEQEDALNRIEGIRSEQLSNRVALQKELKEQEDLTLERQNLSLELAPLELQAINEKVNANQVEIKSNEAVRKSTISLEDAEKSLTSAVTQLAGEQSAVGRALAISQIIQDSAKGVSSAIAAGAGVPFPGNLAAIASGVASVLGGIAQARAILSSDSGSIGGVSGGGISTPSFNLAGASQQSQIIQPQLLQQFSQPVQAQAQNQNINVQSVVSVVDINKAQQANLVKVSESSL